LKDLHLREMVYWKRRLSNSIGKIKIKFEKVLIINSLEINF